jgi:hypothetical protein
MVLTIDKKKIHFFIAVGFNRRNKGNKPTLRASAQFIFIWAKARKLYVIPFPSAKADGN